MITRATTAAERAAIHAFRYDVVVREQGIVADPSIDHTRGTIIDPADETGVVFAARQDDELVGTVRANLLREGHAMPYCRLLGLDRLPDSQRRLVSVTSRLMVTGRRRGTALGIRLAQHCYAHYLAAELAWDFIVVRPGLSRFYQRLGYTPAGRDIEFVGVGRLTALRLNLDPSYLKRVGSVLITGSAGRSFGSVHANRRILT